jgi:hypothetical protein
MLTDAISGLARSGVTRSGYPVLLGAKVPLYAIANIARSGATRSNYTGTQPFITVGGVRRDGGIIHTSVTKSDAINQTPVTLSFTAYGWVPEEGADVVITLGSRNNDNRLFGGTIVSTRHRYAGAPRDRNMLYDVSCIDYTWGLDRHKVSGNYTNATVAAIAASLMTAVEGYTLLVDPDIGAEVLDQITFTEQAFSSAAAQLAKRVGGDFHCDFSKVVHFFFENTALAPPRLVNAVHPTLESISWTRDLSQVATRIYGNFGGSNALDAIAPGANLLPVETAAWYQPEGGRVLVGQQRVTYGGLDVGGGGSLVGPGAAPSGAPKAELLPGPGVDLGVHDYAVTFKTAAGESVPGPRLTVPVGLFLAPPTAPTTGAPGPGVGPDPGVHDYAVSFVISTGETTPGPRVTASTTLLPAPTTGPSPDSVSVGPGPDPGQHDYAVTFLAAGSGETLAGPIGGQITTGGIPAPTAAPAGSVAAGPGPDFGTHYYATTFVRPEGETTVGPLSGPVTTGPIGPPSSPPVPGTPTVGSGPNTGSHRYATTFVSPAGETTPGPSSGAVTTGAVVPLLPPTSAPVLVQTAGSVPQWPVGDVVELSVTFETALGQTTISPWGSSTPITLATNQVNVSQLPLGPPNTVGRLLYRRSAANRTGNVYQYRLSDNTTTVINNLSLGDSVYSTNGQTPPANTAGNTIAQVVPLSSIPVGPTGTTGRRLYRTKAGASTLLFLATLSDNVATTYADTIPDASLGGLPPVQNTAGTAQTVRVSNLQIAADGGGVIARRLYRYTNVGTWGLVATIPDNTTTSYTDTSPNASLGPWPPPANTTTGGAQTIHVSSLPRVSGANGAGATRKLYRRSAGAGLRLVATIPDNTTSTYIDTTPNASLGAAPPTVNAAVLRQIPLADLPLGNTLVTARKLYRTPANAGGGTLQLVATIADNTTLTFLDTVPDASLGAAALPVGTAQAAQVSLTAIPIGAASVIGRVLYRTKAGASQLQVLWVFDDNTSTTAFDTSPDTFLGANAPTSDLSGLQQPSGLVLAGSPTLPCATVAAFRPSGGWAIVGSQNIRYTGISGNALLGIPPTGPGALLASVSWNTTVVAAAMLTGIPTSGLGVIKYQILKGDPVNLFVQVDDLVAQAAVRAQIAGSDGVIEDEIQDGRLSYTEGLARCQARLDLLGARDSEGKVGIITVSYVCRDINTVAGATVTIYLGPPINLQGEFLIQRVSVGKFHVPRLNPTFTAEASSLRFSAEEMLRLLRQGAF